MRRYTLVFLLLSACNLEPAQNSKQLAQEMNDRKIKRVTSAQVTSIVDEWGQTAVTQAQQALAAQLSKRPDTALCQPDRLPAIRKLETLYAARIELLTAADASNPALPAKEREVLEAYLYNAGKGLEQSPNVQKIADTVLVYNAAVPATSIICRTCTNDAALPFVIWRVVFNRREVIRRINVKALTKKQ